MNEVLSLQKEKCEKFSADFSPLQDWQMIAVDKRFEKKEMPVNGLRHPTEGKMSGWWLWLGGDLDQNPEHWDVYHVSHLPEQFKWVLPYLALPSGWRFQIDDKGYEDVWYDERLLKI